MILQVIVSTPQCRFHQFTVEAPTIPDAFYKIPLEAAERGVALMNDGSENVYSIKVIT